MRAIALFLALCLCWLPAQAARCTGSDPCTACSNCSRCAHCNAGGTCGVCSPKKPKAQPTPSDQQAQRCQATTKKGTQCKRTAKPGSSYCWQHQ